MPAFRWNCLLLCLFSSQFLLCHFQPSVAQDASDEESVEERKQLEAVARFMTVLEKNPRRGTAFDRVYGHHVEFGTLDKLVADLTTRAGAAGSKGEVSMILGMVEYQRGNDSGAVDAFSKAESIRSTDPLPSYYLGQAQIRLGDSSTAVASFERALDRKPQRADQLEIFQQLGRLHQRAQRTEEAMKVWKRLEELYPDDPRVLEQIAVTLNEEGQFAEALPRYEKLASTSKDDYRKTTFAIAAAELVVKQGDKSGGIKRMEKLLAELNPDGWLYRDVRRRIDDCFLRTGDQDGLVAYYQSWLEANPKDVEAMNRLARFLKQSARNPEAATWLDKALALAPKRADIRKTYIDLLAEDKRFEEAANQFEQLLSAAPGNADYLRDWGKMILRNKEAPESDRRKKALAVWNRILETNPKDAVLVSQVADLCRQNQMPEEAESLYRKSIELAPTEPQYREYLGEFLHIQKRVDEAKTVWQEIAAGDRRNETNLARLAEIYNSFGFGDEACDKIAESIELSPKDFALVLKGAEYHNKAARFDGAIKLVDQAEKLVANEDERESVLDTRINVLQSSQQLDAESEKLEQRFLANENTTAEEWYRLARYRESQRQWEDATSAINKAIEKAPDSVLAITAAARIAESAGEFGRAADLFRKLTQVDRRSISDHWTSVTRLETQMGRKEEALEAAKQLIVAGPSKTENYEFYAQTCFRLGESDEGMQALRKAIRINPNEPSLMMTLGAALADQLRTDEAIELYWRAYEKSDEVSDKSSMVTKLVPLYSQLNQTDKLFERLERERQDEDNRRSATICIAQAWQTAGDIAEARKELEGLLGENTKDTNLLNQLAKLCLDDADYDSAINYQRQLVSLAPGDETETPLASMLLRVGESEEAREIYARLIASEEDPVRQLRSLDSLLNSGNFDTALRVMEPMLDKQRDDWELLYRYGVCWHGLNNSEEAKARFEQIVALPIVHETLGRVAAAKLKQAQEKARSDNLRGLNTVMPVTQSGLQMTAQAEVVRAAVGLVNQDFYGNTPQPLWTPESYGLARMAAFGWLLRFEEDKRTAQLTTEQAVEAIDDGTTIADIYREAAFKDGASRRDTLDAIYVSLLKSDNASAFTIAKKMAVSGDIEEKRYFLQTLRTRELTAENINSYNPREASTRTPLSEADLELVQSCFDSVNAKTKDQSLESLYGPNLAYDGNGQAYVLVGSSYQMLPGVFRNSSGFLNMLLEEYRYAGKKERIEALIQKQIDSSTTASDWMIVLNTLRQEEKTSQIPYAIEKWVDAAIQEIAERPIVANRTRNANAKPLPLATSSNFFQQWIGQLGSEEENDKILEIFEKIMKVVECESQFRNKLVAASRASASPMPTSNPSNSTFNIQTYYGKTATRVQISFPPISTELDVTSISLLRQVFDVLKKNSVDDDLAKKIRAKVDTDGASTNLWKWCLASVQWWTGDQEDAISLATQLMSENPNDPEMQFRLAALMESQNDFENALAVANLITPKDQNRLVRREILALRLAERIGDAARAKQAAERLFGLRLTTDMQTQLIPQLKRLGMEAQAEAIMNRMERTSSRQPTTLLTLMTLYQSQGKPDNANQAALGILRKTTSPYAASRSNASYSSPNIRTTDSSQRTAALQHLSRSGMLKTLIDQLKEKLDRNPESIHTLEQLVEYSMILNQTKEAQDYLGKAIALRPESFVLRWNLASILAGQGKHKEACDQYLKIFDLQPSWIMEQSYEVQQSFMQAKRQKEFMAKFEGMDLKRIRNPWNLINMVQNNINQDPSSAGAMMGIIERLHDAYPAYRSQIISTLDNTPDLLKNERAFALVKRSVLMSAKSSSSAGTWAGLDDILSYSDRSIEVTFSNLIKMAEANPARLLDLKTAIEQQLEQNPKWLGGQAMLGLLDMTGKNREEGRKRIEKILEDEAVWKDIPYETCWFLGQKLGGFKETEPLAIRLLKEADKRQDEGGASGLDYAPIATLARLVGNRPEERSYLKERIDARDRQQADYMVTYSDPDYESYQRTQRTMGLSELYMTIGYPVDSYVAAKSIENSLDTMSASRYYGSLEYVKSRIQTILDKAEKSITDQSISESLDRLLPLNQSVDLMVASSQEETTKGKPSVGMKSGLLDILTITAKKPETKQLVSSRLAELKQSRPNDLAICIIDLLWQMELDVEGDSLVPNLKQLVGLAKLEPIAEGRRPNNRQRQEAKSIMQLWLVAREVLKKDNSQSPLKNEEEPKDEKTTAATLARLRPYTKHEECRQIATLAADLAIEASLRQLSRAEQSGVLLELSALQARQDEMEQAERNWQRLLTLATNKSSQPTLLKQPEVETSNKEMSPSSQTSLVPPLTISQFRIVMSVHDMAAKGGRMDIAASALGVSLRGGLPVADPETKVADPRQSGMVVFSGNAKPPEDPIEAEVQLTIRESLDYWNKSLDIPLELFEALRLSILPTTRPDDVRLYVNATSVAAGREESLASSLVRIAARSGKLDALRKEVEKRNAKATSLLSKKVLLILIAIEGREFEQAKERMVELNREAEKLTSPMSLQILGLAALKAFATPELKSDSVPILKRLVSSQLAASQPDRNNPFFEEENGGTVVSDLMTKLNGYLIEQGDLKSVRENIESKLQSRLTGDSEYSDGDYVQYMQRTDLANVAKKTAQLGLVDYTLELMGRYSDTPSAGRFGNPLYSASPALEYVFRTKRILPPEERYRAWFDWTMPNDQRAKIRILTGRIRPIAIPNLIARATPRGSSMTSAKLEPGVYSNLSELVLAAAESNQVTSLEAELSKVDEADSPAKKLLQQLLMIQQKNDGEVSKLVKDRVEQHYEWLSKRDTSNSYYNQILEQQEENLLVASFCRSFGYEAEAQKLQILTNEPWLKRAEKSSVNDEIWIHNIESDEAMEYRQRGFGYFAQQATSQWLRNPLTGDFTISFDGPLTGTTIEFGGIRWTTESNNLSDSSGFFKLISSPTLGSNAQRMEIHVKGDQVSFIVNGVEIASERTWGTSPWLALGGYTDRNQWRNLQLDGEFKIPSEIALISTNSLDGWTPSFQDTVHSPRSTTERIQMEQRLGRSRYGRPNRTTESTWRVENGILKAKESPQIGLSFLRSSLKYRRPLSEQETVRYEFFAKKDEVVAHPVIGDVAMVLTSDGLSLHYLDETNAALTIYGLDSDSMTKVVSEAFSSNHSPLKDNEWNEVAVTYANGKVDLTLNGISIYSLPIEPGMSTQFGFFRYQHQASQIRNVVLSGDWPTSVTGTEIAGWNAKNEAYWRSLPVEPSTLRVMDPIQSSDWEQIVRQDNEESVKKLLNLVLPEQGRFPRFTLKILDSEPIANTTRKPVVLNCVATELMRLAEKHKKLDDVASSIAAFREKYPESERFLGALTSLLAMERDDQAVARKVLEDYIQTILADDLDASRHLHQTADFVVAWRASTMPSLRDLSMKILERIQDLDRDSRTRTQDPVLIKWVKRLAGDLQLAADQSYYAQMINPRPQWTPLAFGSQRHDSNGNTNDQYSTWLVTPGKAVHYGSDLASPLIFQSPLNGQFEIVADRTTWDRQEVSIMVAMHSAEPKYNLTGISVTNFLGIADRGSPLDVPGFLEKSRARFRIVVDDNQITTFTNDVKIYEHERGETSSPWIMLEAVYPDFRCEVDDLRIIGSPTIPDELVLTNPVGYEAWNATLYGGSVSTNENSGSNWIFKNAEVAGVNYGVSPLQENYIRYLRPMLEDGIVEYEFWYDEDTEVHPAIGGQAILLDTSGLQTHKITLLHKNEAGLLPNNATPLNPPSNPIDLKSDDWNQVKLELKGNELSVTINKNAIGTVPITDPAHLRHIGMLHFGNKQARFRNMKYRGEWPKTLPPVSEQILAKPEAKQ